MSWKSQDFPLQYQDFPSPKIRFSSHGIQFTQIGFLLSSTAFRFLYGFLTFFNGFPLSPTAFQFSPTVFRFSSMAFHFPRNPRKSIYGKKYMKDRYSSFVFFAARSLSFLKCIWQENCVRQETCEIRGDYTTLVKL